MGTGHQEDKHQHVWMHSRKTQERKAQTSWPGVWRTGMTGSYDLRERILVVTVVRLLIMESECGITQTAFTRCFDPNVDYMDTKVLALVLAV